MKILVTGGAGFIGSHLVASLASANEVWVLDNLSSGKLENLEGTGARLVAGSILDDNAFDHLPERVDWVFHLAAMTSVAESMSKPSECVETNTIGTLKVLEWASKAGAKKFVFASSAAVYGNGMDFPKRENMRPEPQSPYAVSKLDGEFYCDIFSQGTEMGAVCLRFFNVFGPRQSARSAYAAAVPIFFVNALRGSEIVIHGDGEQTRDFIAVDDVVSAMKYVAYCDKARGVYNVGYGGNLSINDLVDKIKMLLGSKSPVRHENDRPGDVKHSVADVDRLRSLGFLCEGTLDSGLMRLAEFYRS
jgi:UDP-glucose 4-epimerase